MMEIVTQNSIIPSNNMKPLSKNSQDMADFMAILKSTYNRKNRDNPNKRCGMSLNQLVSELGSATCIQILADLRQKQMESDRNYR